MRLKKLFKLICIAALVLPLALAGCGKKPVDNGGRDEPGEVENNLPGIGAEAASQKSIRLVDNSFPQHPGNYVFTDFDKWARDLDALLFDFAKNPSYVEPSFETYAPIGFWSMPAKYGERTFGLPSYLGHSDYDPDNLGKTVSTTMRPGMQEGITAMNAVWGATIAGIDKSNQTFTGAGGQKYTYDFVSMLKEYYDVSSGLVLNWL